MQGKFSFALEVVSFFLPIVFALLIDFWLGAMSAELFGISENTYFFAYLGFSIFLTIYNYFRDVWFFKKMQLNAQAVHDKLVHKILNMKTHWVDLYPNSSISFKAFSDIKTLDSGIINSLRNFLDSLMVIVVGLIIWNVMYVGLLLILFIPMVIYYNYVVKSFLHLQPYF